MKHIEELQKEFLLNLELVILQWNVMYRAFILSLRISVVSYMHLVNFEMLKLGSV